MFIKPYTLLFLEKGTLFSKKMYMLYNYQVRTNESLSEQAPCNIQRITTYPAEMTNLETRVRRSMLNQTQFRF